MESDIFVGILETDAKGSQRITDGEEKHRGVGRLYAECRLRGHNPYLVHRPSFAVADGLFETSI